MKTTVLTIVRDYLEAHGYDGLYGEYCACLSGDDMAPCGELSYNCAPGFRHAFDAEDAVCVECVDLEQNECDYCVRAER